MHNVYSYNLPKTFSDYWSTKHVFHQYHLRDVVRFDYPLVKSLRVGNLPLFKFPEIYNNFPGDFKSLRERKDFLLQLDMFYYTDYKISNCNKKYCRICLYQSWIEHKLNFITSQFRSLDYVRYQ